MPKTCADGTVGVSVMPGSGMSAGAGCGPDSTVPAALFRRKEAPGHAVCDVMEQFFKGLQAALLQELVEWSLQQLQAEFFEPERNEDIAVLRTLMRDPQHGSLCTRLTVFLFLFNVHAELKDRVMRIDPGNRAKLARFMADMRKHVVMAFCVDERQQPRDFVRAAHECYILA